MSRQRRPGCGKRRLRTGLERHWLVVDRFFAKAGWMGRQSRQVEARRAGTRRVALQAVDGLLSAAPPRSCVGGRRRWVSVARQA